MRPLVLPANLQHRFYAGGGRIAALRGIELFDDHSPEDWVGATNGTFADPADGPSRLEDGTPLADAIAADPEAFLGAEHVARYGPEPALLVKLLDAGERLPVHFHPGRAFARRELGSPHGKTEAWIIVEAEPGAEVRVGFREDVDPETVRAWVDEQDGEAMIDALRPVPVAAGDAILVPAGTAHAIGAGILLVELQEPTDFSILMEAEPFGLAGDATAHLGLGWDLALQSLDRAEADGVERSPFDPEAAPYFRVERVGGGAELDAGFSILVALEGEGTLVAEDGGELELVRGETVLVPHAAGAARLDGDVTALRCRPPAPDAPEGTW